MDKRFIVALLIIVGVFVGYVFTTKKSSQSTSPTLVGVLTEHKKGAGNKKVSLVEYGDFQCPVCAQYYPILKQIKEKYGDDITFQYRHFPLDSIHPNARAAHRASEAASNQGKFFEMHDLLYETQSSWSTSNNSKAIYEGYANQLGLDLAMFQADYSKEDTNSIINADAEEGKKLGVTGTPGFMINGRLLNDNERRSFDDLVKTIDAEIAKLNTSSTAPLPAATVTPAEAEQQ
jgi:protein-disulfide isomerase